MKQEKEMMTEQEKVEMKKKEMPKEMTAGARSGVGRLQKHESEKSNNKEK